jgi:hypothetical protein
MFLIRKLQKKPNNQEKKATSSAIIPRRKINDLPEKYKSKKRGSSFVTKKHPHDHMLENKRFKLLS